MKWRPEWADLDAETSGRIKKLNVFDTLVIGWLQQTDERPRIRDLMGDAIYEVHPDDRRVCERIYERASIDAEDAVREAYFVLSERFSEIARIDETDSGKTITAGETDSGETVTATDLESMYKNANARQIKDKLISLELVPAVEGGPGKQYRWNKLDAIELCDRFFTRDMSE